MKILFLNIMGYELKDPLEKYLEKHKETTDIFCFQEVYDDSSEYLQHLLTGFNHFFAEKDLGGESRFSLNTFVRSNLSIIENIVLLENSDKNRSCIAYKNRIC